MKGKYAINWIWDWLGLGSMGEDYEVLPTVQPVVMVDGIKWPPQWVQYASPLIPFAASPLSVILPQPQNQNQSRVWLSIRVLRTSPAAGDITFLNRICGTVKSLLVFQTDMTALAPPNRSLPLVGGLDRDVVAGQPVETRGRPTVLSTTQYPLEVLFSAVAPAGSIQIVGLYVDVNASAPLPVDFQA
jgi:hypothetical protein